MSDASPSGLAPRRPPAYAVTVLRVAALALLGASAVVLVNHWLRGEITFFMVLGFALLAFIFSLSFAARGRLWPAQVSLPLLVLAYLTQLVWVGNGFHDVGMIAFPLVILLGGLLLGERAALVFAFLAMISVTAVYVAERRGYVESPYGSLTDWADLVNVYVVLAVTAVLLRLLIANLHRSLERSRRQERELAESYRQLSEQSEEREGLISELEGRNAELERFTYTVSHDLRSPLVTIRGFLGFLERALEKGDQERARADLERIVAATEKMDRSLRELLELSRIGRQINTPVETPLAAIAQEAASQCEGAIRERDARVEIPNDLPIVYGDRPRLVELYQNLIGNAVKFCGDGKRPHVVLGAEREGLNTVFTVRDNGIGIEPEYHDRVFSLFERLDPSIEGTGIGLALVKRIVEVHGGSIWIESEGRGRGTTFCFTLPTPESIRREPRTGEIRIVPLAQPPLAG